MTVRPDREHFVPVRVRDLVDILCHDTGPALDRPLSEADQAAFRRFADAAAERVHHQYLRKLKALTADYAPFDPDADWLALAPDADVGYAASYIRLLVARGLDEKRALARLPLFL